MLYLELLLMISAYPKIAISVIPSGVEESGCPDKLVG